MVTMALYRVVLLLAEVEQRQPLLQRLEPARRAKVMATLAGLLILAAGLMLLAWLGARATRRYMNREPVLAEKPPTTTPHSEKDWADKPLSSPFADDEPSRD